MAVAVWGDRSQLIAPTPSPLGKRGWAQMLPARGDKGFLLLPVGEPPGPPCGSLKKGSGRDLAAQVPGRGLLGDRHLAFSQILSLSANAISTPLKKNRLSPPCERPGTWRGGDERHHPRFRPEAQQPSDVSGKRWCP